MAEFVETLPRRVAHAAHALLAVRDDVNIGPYGPFKASEVVLYDSEALTAGATYQALRRGMKYGLTLWVGRGLWTATNLALDNARALEDRYLRDTDE